METRPEIVKDEHLEYLDGLRKSCVTNMFGAAPYLCDEFGVSPSDARKITDSIFVIVILLSIIHL